MRSYNRIFMAIPLLSAFCFVADTALANPAIIPQPLKMELGEGSFTITSETQLALVGNADAEAQKLADALAPATGFTLQVADQAAGAGAIVLSIDASMQERFGGEGYTLDVTPERVELKAAAPAGLFYGIQTLRQLLPPEIFSANRVEDVAWTVPCVRIADYPRFSWRGLLIDPARHFIPVDDAKRFIDLMALHKFNRLQMHLTDNIAWRVEIKKYPDLTRLASDRDRTGGKGGYYTQDDIRELVRYAAERHVTIVPEIEMPYHAGAAINAYPRLGVDPARVEGLSLEERWPKGERFGKLGGLLAPRPETVAFMQDVLSEVIELFPSPFIHIGGDEAQLDTWENDPEMQAQMKRLGCKNAHELHSWFIKQMDAYVAAQGCRLVGWEEILQGGLAPGAIVMRWRTFDEDDGGVTAAKAGHDVVMAPVSHTYLDSRQHPGELGFGEDVLTLQIVYTFDPISDALDSDEEKYILGGQGQLWGELIADENRREYMAYPRACALIETVWSPKADRDLSEFLGRLKQHLRRLDVLDVNYRPLD